LLLGWRHDSFEFKDLEILAGRPFRKGEERVALLGRTLAENLGKKVGDTVEILETPLEVVGIYKTLNTFDNGAAVVPLAQAQAMLYRKKSVSGFSVALAPAKGDRDEEQQWVAREIESLPVRPGVRLSALPTREYVSGTLYIRLAHAMAWL